LDNAQRRKVSKFEEVLGSLLGRVFHVTRLSYIDDIVASGALIPNRSDVKSPFGNSSNGYFRLKGCVSFFDYRQHESVEWKKHYYKCLPTMAISPSDPAVVMFLSDKYYPNLKSWQGWKNEERWSQQVVPHVEAGLSGMINLDMITELHIWEDAHPEISLQLMPSYNKP